MSSDAPVTIQSRLLAAEKRLPGVLTRDARHNQAGYAYLSEAGAVAPIREALIEEGITIVIDEPTPPVRETAAPRIDKATGALIEQHAITVHLRVDLTGPTGNTITANLYGSAIDRDGRGHSSARTDALKGLRQVFALAAEEPTKEQRPTTQRAQRAQLTRDDVAKKASDLGYTDEQRDFIIDADAGLAATNLAGLAAAEFADALSVLGDPAALEYAQTHAPESVAA